MNKILKGITCFIFWLTLSPVFFFLAKRWKLLGKKMRILLLIVSPFGLLFLLYVAMLLTAGYFEYDRNYRFTNRRTLEEMTGVMLPKFKVVERKKGRGSFNGDYNDKIIIEFKTIPENLYHQLDSLCLIGVWKKSNEDPETYHWGNHWGNGRPAPKGQNDDEDRFISIDITKGKKQATIQHGMW